ncbi:MAG TPA: NAD(P)H-dependent oxidoreductase [Methanoregulaceae archaeon]|jgi:multimeric flavodoxin WrbA|nr:NAD(P)H-dependent oxidoreductase [Methanoregulaceae archaeon]MDD5049008.1 NAD(P)H-dependent oxidoreductase [Methanoregulaceae archaeon]MDD5685272.1 NAD(P)H-dependent oxidoreductase [Methanoregulaceae archaeon]HOP67895.1 NAD(P)H-dependent oxidoreductase [Methanoregulaceae archaeon]HPJ74394.1 NAD(P)H-dependent oxidoreductase [Methanoregulaceae archaeon]
MPAPLVGRKFGIGTIEPLPPEKAKGIKVLGISGSSRQQAGMSKSERLLQRALEQYAAYGCITQFIRLKDHKIYNCEGNYSENPSYCTYPCQSSLKYSDDEMQTVYDAVLDCDILVLATPIRWNNHSALVQKFVERMNCIENQYSWFGNRMIQKKVAGLIIIGHVDGIQHVAGNLLNFFSWLGFHIPDVAIASWVGENDEDTTQDWNQIQRNKYTQEDLQNLIHSSLRLSYQLKQESL